MITFIISKEDFRRMIHGRREVAINGKDNKSKLFDVRFTYDPDRMIILQDESEPMRSRIVQFNRSFVEGRNFFIEIQMLYE